MTKRLLTVLPIIVVALSLSFFSEGSAQMVTTDKCDGESITGYQLLAVTPCSQIPKCGMITTYSQQNDPRTGRLVSVPFTRCTCCYIAECGARGDAWRVRNMGSNWRAPQGCAFGSCPPNADVYYFAPDIR